MKNVSRMVALAAVASMVVFPGSALAGYRDSSYLHDITREDLVDFEDELEFLNEAGRYTAVSGDDAEAGGWSARYFVDTFGRPTGQRYVVSLVDDGYFNNRVTSYAELTSQVIFEPITSDDWFMQIFLYKYNRSQVLGVEGDVTYDVSVLSKHGVKYTCEAELPRDGDRIQFSYMDSNEIKKMISAGGPVSIVLTNAKDRLESFVLTFNDNAGFDDACDEVLTDLRQLDAGSSVAADRAAGDGSYADGIYVGTGIGPGGLLSAMVTISDGTISDIVIGDNNELRVLAFDNDNYTDDVSKALEELPKAIIEANGTDGVDVIDGAEKTSEAILTAVNNALANARDASAFGRSASKDGLAASDQESGGGDSRSLYRLPDAIVDTDAAVTSRKYHAFSGRSSSASEDVTYRDGKYEGSARGAESEIKVSVTVENGKITDVRADGQETRGVGSQALDQLPDAIVAANGTAGVDAVTGATVTSKAIFAAVDDALEDAESTAGEPLPSSFTYQIDDGTYTGEAEGMESTVTVEVAVKDGKITDVKATGEETENIGSKALDVLPPKIVQANGTRGVDTYGGATVTSQAIFAAVNEALAGASAGDGAAAASFASEGAVSYKDGEYTGSAKGMESIIEVTVTVAGGIIIDVEATGEENKGIGSKAIEQVPDKIVKANGTDGVDGVSGASVTSKAIFDAVDQALAGA